MIFGTLYHHHNLQILQQETTKMTTLVTHMSSEATLTSEQRTGLIGVNIPNMLRYLNSCLRRCYKKKVTSPMALPLAAFSFWLMTTTGVEVTGIRMEHQVHVQPHMNVNIPPHPITHLTPPETLHWRNTNITFSRKLHHSMGPIHEYDELTHGI